MNNYPAWQYDEMKQIGKDYGNLEEVEAYDVRHGKFRDIEKENEAILESLRVKTDHVLIDIGTGTGAFALKAARSCAKVYAVDISRAMLEYGKKRLHGQVSRTLSSAMAAFLPTPILIRLLMPLSPIRRFIIFRISGKAWLCSG